MADLAAFLPQASRVSVDLRVVDRTGLKGAFQFKLDWSLPATAGHATGADAERFAEVTIVDALRSQLGLGLERRRAPVPVLIVDHIEAPFPN